MSKEPRAQPAVDDRAGARTRPRRLLARLTDPSREAMLVTAVLLTYAYFPPTAGWNENSRFDLTRAIVDRGSLYIDDFRLNTGDKARCGGTHYCSDKAPGASFAGVIPYAIYRAYQSWRGSPPPRARVIFASARRAESGRLTRDDRVQVNASFLTALYVVGLFVSAVPGAIAVLLLVRLCRRRGVAERPALVVGALYGVGTIAFPFSTTLFGHQLAACLLLAAFTLVERCAELEQRAGRSWRLLLAGSCGGYAVVTEYPLAIPVLGLALWFFVISKNRWQLGWYLLGGAPAAAGLLAFLWAAFGNPLTIGYAQLADPEFARGQGRGFFGLTYPRWRRLWGTLCGRFRGLFYISPVLLLSVVGWIRLWRDDPRWRPTLAYGGAVAAYFVLLNASYFMWSGGASAGPRHVVPALPFFCLALAGVVAARGWRLLVGVLGGVSVLDVLAVTVAGVKAAEHGDILFDYAWPTVLGAASTRPGLTLGALLGLPPLVDLIVIIVFWSICVAALFRPLQR